MPIQLDVWSDYVCPYCFAASLSVDALQTTHDLALRWHAYELRPAGAPPIPPEYLAHIERSRPRVQQMFLDQHGVEIQPGPFGIATRDAHIATTWVESQSADAGLRFHDRVFRAYWVESQNISDPDVLAACVTAVGLDGAALKAMLADPAQRARFEAEAEADIDQASAMNLSGVPALIFEGRYLVPGAVPTETLRRIVDQLQAEGASAR
jgi:predicted DsbA family dithiol-disulfide isomerase